MTDEVKKLIDGMLTMDPDKRITAEQALSHPWIKVIDTIVHVHVHISCLLHVYYMHVHVLQLLLYNFEFVLHMQYVYLYMHLC